MRSTRRLILMAGGTSAALATAVFACYEAGRGGLPALGQSWDRLLAVAALTGILAFAAAYLVARHYRQTLQLLGSRTRSFAHNPERRADELFALPDPDGELGALLEPLEIVCTAHSGLLREREAERSRLSRQLEVRGHEMAQASEYMLRMHRDLARLKESYKDLYHNAPVMFFSLDQSDHFVACNDTLLRALGYQREDLTGQAYTHLLPPGERKKWQREGTSPFRREDEIECQWVKKDGAIIDVLIRTIPIRDDDGNFVRSRSAAQDVTLHNRLSQELRRRGDELERANVQLRRTNRELEEFTSVVSHDLKEPLRTIEAYSNALAREFGAELGADGFQSINHLVLASRRLGALIDDLLALTRAGRAARRPEGFEFHEVVATVRRDLADMLQRRNGEIVCEGALPTVVGDRGAITQLLSNLVANALKYNESAVPRVIIEAASSGGLVGRGFATLCVRDNGIGIDPRYHDEIFRPFRRLHTGDHYEGTGAGLAICKRIVEGHGGRIWVESTPGQGSAFYCTLPLLQSASAGSPAKQPASAPQPATPQPATPQPATPQPASPRRASTAETRHVRETFVAPADGSAARILLVEDIAEIALLTQRIAGRAGYGIVWVTSAEAAWNHLRRERPDLVLLDVHLPGMSGDEFCRRLRSRPEYARLPIALFTQSNGDPDRARECGANHVLTKDLLVKPQQMLIRLREILEEHSVLTR